MFVCSACGTCLARCTARCLLIHLAAEPRARSSDSRAGQLQTKYALIKYKPLLQVIFFLRHSLDTSLDTICGWSANLIHTWDTEKKKKEKKIRLITCIMYQTCTILKEKKTTECDESRERSSKTDVRRGCRTDVWQARHFLNDRTGSEFRVAPVSHLLRAERGASPWERK